MRKFALLLAVLALPLQAQQHHRAVTPPPGTPAAWLQQHAIRLQTAERSTNDSDLMPFLPLVANARVVALGDATHGTHEFFTLKERLVPFLIAHAGFRTVAFEAPYEWEQLDTYVRTGNGDPATILQSGDYFFWDTQEILQLIESIRAWNEAGNPTVGIAGIDSVHPRLATSDVVAYLAAVDQAASLSALSNYDCVNTNWANFNAGDTCIAPAQAVYAAMQSHAAAYVQATSQQAFDGALHAARVAVEAAEAISTRRLSRDASLAENAQWLAAREKTIVIGHQTHFGRSPYYFGDPRGTESAGGYLNEALGNAYVTFATTTLHGRFNAGVRTFGNDYVMLPFDYDGTQTYAAQFAGTGMPAMIVSFHQPLPRWFTGTQHLPIAFSTAIGNTPPLTDIVDDVSKAYDGIVYIENTMASEARQ